MINVSPLMLVKHEISTYAKCFEFSNDSPNLLKNPVTVFAKQRHLRSFFVKTFLLELSSPRITHCWQTKLRPRSTPWRYCKHLRRERSLGLEMDALPNYSPLLGYNCNPASESAYRIRKKSCAQTVTCQSNKKLYGYVSFRFSDWNEWTPEK